jgi:hypothetical protein
MNAYTLFNIEIVEEIELRVPKVAVEITMVCQVTLQWDKMYAGYVTTLSKFK